MSPKSLSISCISCLIELLFYLPVIKNEKMSLEVQVKKKSKGVTSEQPSHICSKLDSSIQSGLKRPDVKVGTEYSKAESISNNLQLHTV